MSRKFNVQTIVRRTIGCLASIVVTTVLFALLYGWWYTSRLSYYDMRGAPPVTRIRVSLDRGLVTSMSLTYEDASSTMVDLLLRSRPNGRKTGLSFQDVWQRRLLFVHPPWERRRPAGFWLWSSFSLK
jgi:hypothetical protein